ncbi:MAG: hypothetical protein IJC99_04780 [Clostridia bacterium]|nr:hypothetical protein [Clostridia bacterium]
MNEQSRKKIAAKNHFHVLDLALLLLALFLIVGIWQRDNLRFLFEGERDKSSYSVSFSVSAVPPEAAALLTADTVLYTSTEEGNTELGRLLDDARVLPRTHLMPREDGEDVVEVFLPTGDLRALCDLTATFVCRGVLRDGVLVLDNGLLLRPDMELSAHTARGEVQIFVRAITENL